jgi:hypothetical protein
VVWAETEAKEGKPSRKIPLDAEHMGGWDSPTKHDNGNLVAVGSTVGEFGSTMVVRYVPAGPGRYRSHFVSCPNAKEHRRAKH